MRVRQPAVARVLGARAEEPQAQHHARQLRHPPVPVVPGLRAVGASSVPAAPPRPVIALRPARPGPVSLVCRSPAAQGHPGALQVLVPARVVTGDQDGVRSLPVHAAQHRGGQRPVRPAARDGDQDAPSVRHGAQHVPVARVRRAVAAEHLAAQLAGPGHLHRVSAQPLLVPGNGLVTGAVLADGELVPPRARPPDVDIERPLFAVHDITASHTLYYG